MTTVAQERNGENRNGARQCEKHNNDNMTAQGRQGKSEKERRREQEEERKNEKERK